MAEKKKGFDLAAALGGVSNLNTGADGREQIEYIDIDLIHPDERNFYAVDGIDELAANIECCGLQQPVRLRPDDDGVGYVLVSGHRRHAALRKLVDDGVERFRAVPSIVERDTATGETAALLQELRLIYANSDTRRMSSADLAKQAERVEMLLYQLKEAGVEFPGRMRDHVAEACKLSASKLARLKVIREKLIPELKKYWDTGKMNDAVAYACAQHSAEMQRRLIEVSKVASYCQAPDAWMENTVEQRMRHLEADAALKCKETGGQCDNRKRAERCVQTQYCGDHCVINIGKCCSGCPSLAKCKSACPHLADEIKKAKAVQKKNEADRAADMAAKEEAHAKKVAEYEAFVMVSWRRLGSAMDRAGYSAIWLSEVMDWYATEKDLDVISKLLRGEAVDEADDPCGYGDESPFECSNIFDLITLANDLAVSLDYLFCRTDDPNPASSAGAAPHWRVAAPQKSGQYVCEVSTANGESTIEAVYWDAVKGKWHLWLCGYTDSDDATVERWFPLPAESSRAAGEGNG